MEREYPDSEEYNQKNIENNQISLEESINGIYDQNHSGPTTYLKVENETQIFEVDLIQFREKNVLTKYLAVTLTQQNPDKPDKPYIMSFSIPDEQSFDVVKHFFNQLNWNN